MRHETGSRHSRAATPTSLYVPATEHDSCGIGFLARLDNTKSHDLVLKALEALHNLDHRGACGCDPLSGDGAGILMQISDGFFRKRCADLHIPLPAEKHYGLGMVFLPRDAAERNICEEIVESAVAEVGLKVLGWRQVPIDERHCGRTSLSTRPDFAQVFVAPAKGDPDETDLERRLYTARKIAENKALAAGGSSARDFYVSSLSCRTVVYKGMLLTAQLPLFFPDLGQEDMDTAIALVHSRFSTNTLPTWSLAQPFRYLCHNGEINTVRGNTNWMNARERLFQSPLFGEDVAKLLPIIKPGQSDSAVFDNALELLYQTGRSLPHASVMMIPEAWEKHESMPEERRAFYQYHGSLMEPWDGPACIAFTDGHKVGAILDRNGLRPSRYTVTKDGMVIVASETGVINVPPEMIEFKGRLQPGRIFCVDVDEHRIIDDGEIKKEMAVRQPYGEWLKKGLVELDSLPMPARVPAPISGEELVERQAVFAYTQEELKVLLTPMALNGQEPIGSMGTDTPLAVLSDRPQLLFNYFKQLFAQVTNPAIDPIREELIMSLQTTAGRQQNLFDESPDHCRQLRLPTPCITNEELASIREIDANGIRCSTIPIVFDSSRSEEGLEEALARVCEAATKAVDDGFELVILSDREAGRAKAPIPSLLATGAVHHHLIRNGRRTKVGLIIESGEPREVMHVCLLTGYGASAVNPYVAMDTIRAIAAKGALDGVGPEEAVRNYVKAVGKGLLKTMSKMGISTQASYRGAQIFEAIGINSEVIDRCFFGTASRVSGIGFDVIAEEARRRHASAFGPRLGDSPRLDPGGQYYWRRRGEFHLTNPETVAKLQQAVRSGDVRRYEQYAELINEQSRNLCTLRSLLTFKADVEPIPIDEVEPASEIVKRFKTGAMSYGSISKEAHENLAIAMNRIGAKSNTGEGGEDPERFVLLPNGDSARSAIKQVASGRFGVTCNYLTNADEIQIKIAQGAKPGEGGQLPGHKVNRIIAKTRHSTPGVGLISPPPHHDIYSIEDLAQLIHDLKNANPTARVSVKLVAEVGVGTIAAGVSKAKADVVLISGFDGGTGASPLSSIKHAGVPWELGLAETQQVLVQNDLRSRIRVETDGQLKTGRDVAIAALLGADEFGFATAALIASGCIMMRKCHLNTCPVGIATQDETLRKRFSGKPEHVVNFMTFVAEDLRAIMAELGFRTVQEMTGRVDMLDATEALEHWKARGLDLSAILHRPDVRPDVGISGTGTQEHGLEKALDNQIIAMARPALEEGKAVQIDLPISNTNRTVCTTLSHEVSKRYSAEGLPPHTIRLNFTGSAGQSFGAFLAKGISAHIEGDANDYFCKGMSGGLVTISPPRGVSFKPEENIIIGNVALYGATGGEVFVHGKAGERCAVRNSGATIVVESVGDHGCEYMTGGRMVCLGETGRNFAAGMSGGLAYVFDRTGDFRDRCNLGMVELFSLEDEEEIAEIRLLVHRHQRGTGSAVAEAILGDWDRSVALFVKVFPTEYRRVLEQLQRESQETAAASV
ncbi:MAG: glutamate synthase large subunit [Candidatus Binatia bacterium]